MIVTVTAQVYPDPRAVVYLNLMIGDSRSHQLNSPRISSESMPEYPIDSHSLAVAATYKKGNPIQFLLGIPKALSLRITHQTRVSDSHLAVSLIKQE